MNELESTATVMRTLRELGHLFHDLVGLADNRGTLLYLNFAGREMAGIGAGEPIKDHTIQMLFPGFSVDDFAQNARENRHASVGGGTLSMSRDAALSAAGGWSLPMRLSASARLSTDGEIEFILAVARDATVSEPVGRAPTTPDRREMDVCRWQTIGRLTTGLARNLDISLGEAENHANAALDMTAGTDAGVSVAAALRIIHSTRYVLKQLTGPDTVTRCGAPAPVKQVLRDAISMARVSLPGTVVVRQRYEETCDPLVCCPYQVRDIVLNLIENARESIDPTGGVLEIGLDTVQGGSRTQTGRVTDPPQGYARITVGDNGPGLSRDIVSNLLEESKLGAPADIPSGFYTVTRLVESCGGSLTIHNRIGRGTRFHVFIPTVPPSSWPADRS